MEKIISRFLKTLLLLIVISSNAFSQGQNTTQGKEFWLAFGNNDLGVSTLQIRVIATKTTSVKLTFTQNGTSRTFNVNAGQVYTHTITDAEKALVYNNATGTTNKSVHIVSDENVSVFAINLASHTTDATNVLPVNNYGTSYHHISYRSISGVGDGYTVIATEDNTIIKDEGQTMATINKGQVYSRYFGLTDATGRNITSDKPIAYFTTNSCVQVPNGTTACDCLFQQQVPVYSWGNTFLVPVTKRGKERVRVVASQDGTKITQTGGTLISGVGTGSLSLNAGQFVELEVALASGGCYIKSDKPVAVASFLTGLDYSGLSYKNGDPAMAWVPPIEQTVMNVAIAPFVETGTSVLEEHHALIVTPTATKSATTMTIGSGSPQALFGGSWTDNTASGYSFYSIQMTEKSSTYYFENAAGLSVMGYGLGSYESYYYLAASSARQLNPSFYINDIHFQDADGQTYCTGPFTLRSVANMTLSTNPGRIKWYINGTEVTDARDKVEWTKTNFPLDVAQEIKLVILDAYGQEFVMYSTITVVDPQPLTVTGSPYICPPATSTVLTAQSGPSRYQWYKDGTAILGATQNTYTVAKANVGDYSVIGYYGTCESPMSETVTVVDGCEPSLTVTYDANGATGTVPTDANVYSDNAQVTVLAHGDLTKTEAVFIGWSFGQTNLITKKADEPTDLMAAGDQFKITADETLYAVWAIDKTGPGGESDSIPDYLQNAVLYDANGASGTVPMDANVYNDNDQVTVLAHGDLKKTGAVFIGWSFGQTNLITKKADEPTDLKAAGDQFTITTDTTLYAVWAIDKSGPGGEPDSIPDYLQITVLYDANGASGTAPTDANVYNNGDPVTVLAHGNLEKTDAVFIGWSFGQTNLITAKADEPTDLMVAGDQFTITADTMLYAVWAKDASGPGGEPDSIPDYLQLAVIYDANGATGTLPVDGNVYNNGDPVTVKANSGLEKANATFIGWSFGQTNVITQKADEPSDLMIAGDQFAITANTTLYAVWAADSNGPDGPDVPGGGGDSIPDYLQYAVTYNGNGEASGTPPSDPAIYSSTDLITAKANTGNLARTAKIIFAGWTPNTPVATVVTPANPQDTTTAFVRAGGTFSISANTTMFAVWASDENNNGTPDIWEDGYAVTYNANGASGTPPSDAATYLTGMPVTVKANSGLTKTDATFIGWSFGQVGVVTSKAGEPADLMQPNDIFTISGNTTLYAVWAIDETGPGGEPDSIPDYDQFGVTYNANGAGGFVPVDANRYNNNDNVVVLANSSLTKSGAAFIGWSFSLITSLVTDYSEEPADLMVAGDIFAITAETTLYAVWAKDDNGNGIPDYREAKITFNPGMAATASSLTPRDTIVEKGYVTLTGMGFKMPSYILIGWHTRAMPFITLATVEAAVIAQPTFYAIGDSINVQADITLYAVWAIDKNNDGYPDYGGNVVKPELRSGVVTLNGLLSGDATGNEAISGAKVWSYGSNMYINAEKATRINIYTISGMLYKQMDLPEGITTEPLSGGIYIVEMDGVRYKVVVKQ